MSAARFTACVRYNAVRLAPQTLAVQRGNADHADRHHDECDQRFDEAEAVLTMFDCVVHFSISLSYAQVAPSAPMTAFTSGTSCSTCARPGRSILIDARARQAAGGRSRAAVVAVQDETSRAGGEAQARGGSREARRAERDVAVARREHHRRADGLGPHQNQLVVVVDGVAVGRVGQDSSAVRVEVVVLVDEHDEAAA